MGVNLKQNPDNSVSLVADNGSHGNYEVFRSDNQGGVRTSVRNTIARTDTAAKNLFTLPAGAIPVELRFFSAAASNAGTSANVSVGKSGGTGTEYMNALDVKTVGTGQGLVVPNGQANMFASVGNAPLTITGIYAESGTASTAGGPWTVEMSYVMN